MVKGASALLEEWGYKVRLAPHLLAKDNQFAGSDDNRAADMQAALDDPKLKAVFCARGGYGTIRILDQLNFKTFASYPKWIIGYSDVTVLHSHLQQVVKSESLHATMPVNFKTNSQRSLDLLKSTLAGEDLSYKVPPHPLNRMGSGRGILTGGNLSILYSLKGSHSFPDLKGRILFLEDLDEYLYHVDRMVMALRRTGAFNTLSGMIVGGMTKMNDNEVPFGKTAEEIIRGHLPDLPFPVCFGFPAGHIDDNCPLILGRMADLSVTKEGAVLEFSS